jgi:hypothetical protein
VGAPPNRPPDLRPPLTAYSPPQTLPKHKHNFEIDQDALDDFISMPVFEPFSIKRHYGSMVQDLAHEFYWASRDPDFEELQYSDIVDWCTEHNIIIGKPALKMCLPQLRDAVILAKKNLVSQDHSPPSGPTEISGINSNGMSHQPLVSPWLLGDEVMDAAWRAAGFTVEEAEELIQLSLTEADFQPTPVQCSVLECDTSEQQ